MLQFNINDKKKCTWNNSNLISTRRLNDMRADFLLYAIKEITKMANNSIEFKTMQVDVQFFFSKKYVLFTISNLQTPVNVTIQP